jgi:Esterase-like activity of phytase
MSPAIRKPEVFTQHNPVGEVVVSVAQHDLQIAVEHNIAYQGTANAQARTEFAAGFVPSYGSGLSFKAKLPDGTLEFYAITDRGPNDDGPTAASGAETKIFPAPSFVPAIGVLRLGSDGAVLQSRLPLQFDPGRFASGLPQPPGRVGATGEVPLTDGLRFEPEQANFSQAGLDPESVVFDAARAALWVSDEYGPHLLKIDPATGVVQKRYQPGPATTDLPQILLKRRANRGMEGLALDAQTGQLHGFLQSPIDDGEVHGRQVRDHALFCRWLEFDPDTQTSKLYAYPLDGAHYLHGQTGHAKLGDLTALGAGRFIVIEQGDGPDGRMFNRLMLVEVPADATNIANIGSALEKNSLNPAHPSAVAYKHVVGLRKSLLLDLNQIGWVAEKAEGLCLVDEHTLVVINDTDFGMKTVPDAAHGMRVTRNDPANSTQRIWVLRFHKPLSEFRVKR